MEYIYGCTSTVYGHKEGCYKVGTEIRRAVFGFSSYLLPSYWNTAPQEAFFSRHTRGFQVLFHITTSNLLRPIVVFNFWIEKIKCVSGGIGVRDQGGKGGIVPRGETSASSWNLHDAGGWDR